ncbi:MAG: glycosyltransferase family 4 protein [Bryobacterales bacterium]|nr:glycosyltransferase family 4 protein [Bryobacterales bacterium]
MQVRILHVIGDSKFGGASLGILRLARHWRTLNWDVSVLSTDPDFQEAATKNSVQVVPLDAVWREIRPVKDLIGLWRLTRFLRASEYTIVHTHTTKAGFIGRLAAWMAGVPVVVHTSHGFAFHEASHPFRIAFYVALDRVASWCCDKVITVSNFHANWGIKLGIAAPWKIQSIPNGIPAPALTTEDQRSRLRQSLGIDGDTLMLLTHGRLAAEKGLEDLLDAVAAVPSRAVRKFRLVLAGTGPLRAELEDRVRRLAIEDMVLFLGFRTDVAELLNAADLVVLPTWREGLSIALLEAMAAGCCIVTTSISPNREPTQDGRGAFLVPAKSPESIAQAIESLLSDPLRRHSYGSQARSIFEENYSMDRMLGSYQQVYRTLLEEKEVAYSVSAVLPSHDR